MASSGASADPTSSGDLAHPPAPRDSLSLSRGLTPRRQRMNAFLSNPVIQDACSALLAASVLAVLAFLFSRARNLRWERDLKRAVDQNGVGWSMDHNHVPDFSLQIHNYSNASIRVRSVVLVADRFKVELSPMPNRGIEQTPILNELTREKFKRTLLSRQIEPDNNPHALILPPKTMGIWIADPHTISSREWKIVKAFIAFEYPTLFGNTALIRVELPERALGTIKKVFDELSSASHNKRPMKEVFDLLGLPHPAARA